MLNGELKSKILGDSEVQEILQKDIGPREVQALSTSLQQLKQNGPHIIGDGICTNAADGLGKGLQRALIRALCTFWGKYSGNICFPVPHPRHCPELAYCDTADHWNRETQYARDRWELLDFLIDATSAILSNRH